LTEDPKTIQDDLNADFGKRFRALRKARGDNQTDAGKVLGVTFQQIQKYENGSNRMSVGSLIMMADHYGVTPESLLPPCSARGDRSLIEQVTSQLSQMDDDQLQSLVTITTAMTGARKALFSFARNVTQLAETTANCQAPTTRKADMAAEAQA